MPVMRFHERRPDCVSCWVGRVAASACLLGVALVFGKPASAFDKQTCAVAYENAQQLRNKLKLRRARDQLLICGHSTCPAVVTKDCNAWLEEVEQELTSVVLRARDARGQSVVEARVFMDGEFLRDRLDGTSVFVDPGMHVFRFESDAGTGELRQMLRKGERDRLLEAALRPRTDDAPPKAATGDEAMRGDAGTESARKIDSKVEDSRADVKAAVEMQLEPPARSSGPPIASYAVAGVGVVALSSFAYFGLKATSRASDLRGTCAPHCSQDDIDGVRGQLVAANVSLGIGIAALGVAGVLWWMNDSNSSKTASSLRFDVVPASRGQGATVVATVSAP